MGPLLQPNCQQTSMAASSKHALTLKILAECSTTKARACLMTLPHNVVDTPVFMPVGTQGTLKGLMPEQLEELDCQIILGNTYHLGHRPVSRSKYTTTTMSIMSVHFYHYVT